MAYRGEGNSGDWSLEDYLRRNSDAFAMVMPFQGVALRGEGPENRSRVFLISSGNRNIVVFETESGTGGGDKRDAHGGLFRSHRLRDMFGAGPVFRRMIPVDRVTGRRSFLLRVIRREDLGRNPGSLSNLSTDGVNDARGSIVELSWVNDFEPGFTDY
uniref:Uncharacterized protein n=1 Tax=Vitis vinifera TaxID=29760 RepID=A5C833_VITVI|nr:hypothetical protein VITISV_033334 [Vitis vinifera]